LFKVSSRLNGKNAGVHFLAKEVLGPLHGLSILEEGQGPENLFLVVAELLQGQVQIQCTGVEKGSTGASFTKEVEQRGEFWPHPLFGQGRRDNRRGRQGYRRQSDCWSGGRVSYELGELL